MSGESREEAFEEIKADGILIKNLDAPGTPLADALRVSVGTAAENQRFLDVLASLT